MATNLRQRTRYPGVFFREAKRLGGPGGERVYYILFKQGGKVVEEKVGRQFADSMTEAKANNIRSERLEGRRESRKAVRERIVAEKEALESRPTHTGTVDVILAADLTEHLDDGTFSAMLEEARRALRPGGYLVLYTPEASHLFERLRDAGVMKQDPSHIGVRTGKQLAVAVQQHGFTLERLAYLPSHLPGWQVLERALARWVPLLRRRAGVVGRRPG